MKGETCLEYPLSLSLTHAQKYEGTAGVWRGVVFVSPGAPSASHFPPHTGILQNASVHYAAVLSLQRHP